MDDLYDQGTADGERHQPAGQQLEAAGFTIHERDDAPHDNGPIDLADLFVGGCDLDTPEGCDAAIAEVRRGMERDAA